MSVNSYCRVLCIFSCLVIGSVGKTSRSRLCELDWTAATRGGSCSFDNGSLCGWSNEEGDGLDWAVDKGVAQVKGRMFRKAKAVLTSPGLCATSQVCLGLRYKVNSSRGKLSIQRCSWSETCQTVWSADGAPSGQWQSADVPVEAYRSFTHTQSTERKEPFNYLQIRVIGEKISWREDPEIYIDTLTYSNSSCNQTGTTQGAVNFITTTTPESINNSTPITTVPVPTQETLSGGGSLRADFDSTLSSGIAAAAVATGMLIAVVVVVTRYYVKNGRCRQRFMMKNNKSSPGQSPHHHPVTASNELYNVLGITRQNSFQPAEILLTQLPQTNDPEVNIYWDIDYTHGASPKCSQRSLPFSVKTCTVKGNAEDSGPMTLTLAETTRETVYQNVDPQLCCNEPQQGSSSSTHSRVTKETIYQNVGTSL